MSFRLLIVLVLFVVGCRIGPEKRSIDDPKVVPMMRAAESVDRGKYGFSPLPSTGTVRVEWKSLSKDYDAMLHLNGRTSRTISFRRSGDGYRWIGEQEIFRGPREYETEDGRFHEQITLTYNSERKPGWSSSHLLVIYSGPRTEFADPTNLTLSDVQPMLKAWGY